MEKKSWACTVFTQLCLCIALYVALNIGHSPQSPSLATEQRGSGGPFDIYFITVAGGFRPVGEQTLLLQQVLKATKTFKARFVVDITELGGLDPLLQNATLIPDLQRIPWYTTGALGGQRDAFFLKKIEIPYGQTLDIIALDTMLFQDMLSARGNDQILWLKRILKESESDWRIVFGYHELMSCKGNKQKMEEGKSSPFGLLDVLPSYGVDAYISSTACPGRFQGGSAMGLSITGHNTMNQKLIIKDSTWETVDVNGFLLHRISTLEMETFAVKLTGEIEQKVSFPQRGRATL